jgi:hypothetical protein
MDLDDIPLLRHLKWLWTAAQFLMILAGLFIFPLLIIQNYQHSKEAEYVNERRFYQCRMWAFAFLFNPYLMIMLSVFHNMLGHPGINPCEGEWLFISWIFSSDHGQPLFYDELGLMLGLAAAGLAASWYIGESTDSGTFIPRYYRRMH